MTPTEASNNRKDLHCFWCLSNLGNHPNARFVTVCSDDNQIINVLNVQSGNVDPMVFCSSDCMVVDCHHRYQDRISKGTFRKRFDTQYQDKLPARWREGAAELIKEGSGLKESLT